jgi:hypothetical protein
MICADTFVQPMLHRMAAYTHVTHKTCFVRTFVQPMLHRIAAYIRITHKTCFVRTFVQPMLHRMAAYIHVTHMMCFVRTFLCCSFPSPFLGGDGHWFSRLSRHVMLWAWCSRGLRSGNTVFLEEGDMSNLNLMHPRIPFSQIICGH